MNNIFRVKRLDSILAKERDSKNKLRRALGAFDVIMPGIGTIIGTGIFATVGTAAARDLSCRGA
ncbi:MAG: hypothetical protein P4L27_05815 [Ignavibacteriaceae bacterium]|nr:hypothetical protein [Ignavibacteriaceae bacterium]